MAGFNLHPEDGNYKNSGTNGPREAQNIINPIFQANSDESPTGFSIANNVIDFGIRAYLIEKNSKGTGYLRQIFPRLDSKNHQYEYLAVRTMITKSIQIKDFSMPFQKLSM